MRFEIIIPILLAALTGIFAWVGYMAYKRRISRPLAVVFISVMSVLVTFACGYVYRNLAPKHVAGKSPVKVDALDGTRFVQIGLVQPEQLFGKVQGKAMAIKGLYLVGVSDRKDGRLYAFSNVPGGALSRSGNLVFFGHAATKAVEQKLDGLSRMEECVVAMGFTGLNKLDGPDGYPIHAFMVTVFDAKQ